MTAWHNLSLDDVAQELETDRESGLSGAEVARRQQVHGPNELADLGGRAALRIIWEQFSSAMVVLLVLAALVSVFLAEYVDAFAIGAIILLNATLGFVQDFRAEKALAALRRLAVPTTRVRRDGTLQEISANELVPGDVLMLEAGNMVPADGRVIESMNLRVDEASLTGESEPVEKGEAALSAQDAPLGDRTNMVYRGTLATYGHGVALVTATGMETELGKIARSLQTVTPEPTPLQRRLAQLGRTLAIVSIAIVALVYVLGVVVGEDPRLMLMTALSLAVAIVPEGLPTVATVALAIGARRMLKRQALIRKLPAVETLGSVTVICSDKTGTLTENRMTVTVLDVAGRRLELTEAQRADTLPASDDNQSGSIGDTEARQQSSLALLLAGAALCNDAELSDSATTQGFDALGEPTEAALVVGAARLGFDRRELAKILKRVDEVPFDSQRKRMATVHHVSAEATRSENATNQNRLATLLDQLESDEFVVFMKGAVDAVLDVCTHVWMHDRSEALDDSHRTRIMQSNDELAASGMRVLGVAFRRLPDQPRGDDAASVENELTFVGMLGMIDPPRPEVSDAVVRCQTAGVRPIMITGDHPLTAVYIARQLGIGEDKQALVGKELAQLTPEKLESATGDVSVYARVAPQDKLHIVQALQNLGHVVAMTGDGVNDAPALKQAHIGVAMGQIGTDVSKEASDMVLLDDNFATIVNAVEAGRIVYDNIRKFVKYTMTSNAGEICVMVFGPLLGMPLPLLPLQILWINLVTDGLPGLALAVEPAERDTMRRPPYPPNEHIMGRGMWRDIAWVGILMGAVSLAMGYFIWAAGEEAEAHWRTTIFTVLTLSQMGNALAVRSSHDSLFKIGLFSNKALLGSVLLTFLLQLAVIYWRPLQEVFKTTSLSWTEFVACLALSTVVFWVAEAKKLVVRMRSRSTPVAQRPTAR